MYTKARIFIFTRNKIKRFRPGDGVQNVPFNYNIILGTVILCLHIDNQMKFKHAAVPFTYTLHAHTGSLQKYILKKSHEAS